MTRTTELALGVGGGVVVGGVFFRVGGDSLATSVLAGLASTAMWLVTGLLLRRRGKS